MIKISKPLQTSTNYFPLAKTTGYYIYTTCWLLMGLHQSKYEMEIECMYRVRTFSSGGRVKHHFFLWLNSVNIPSKGIIKRNRRFCSKEGEDVDEKMNCVYVMTPTSNWLLIKSVDLKEMGYNQTERGSKFIYITQQMSVCNQLDLQPSLVHGSWRIPLFEVNPKKSESLTVGVWFVMGLPYYTWIPKSISMICPKIIEWWLHCDHCE